MSDSVAAAPPAEPPAEPASNGNKSEPEPEHKKEEKPKKAVKPKKKEETKRKQDDSTKKPAVKKVKKDPNAPKKPRSAFTFFVIEHRKTIVEANPDAQFGDISKLVGAAYKNLNSEQIAKYETLAKQDTLRYVEEMANYTPPDAGSDDGKPTANPGTKKKAKNKPGDATKDGEELNSDKATNGENGGTPKRETLVDNVTTPAAEKAKSDSAKKSSVKKSPKNHDKSPSDKPQKKSGKPTYLGMVQEAIATLKDRTGSSSPAVLKWIKANCEAVQSVKPDLVKNFVTKALAQGVKEGRFVKVKASFKINPEWTKKQKAAVKAIEAAKKKAEKERKKELAQSNEDEDKTKAEEERSRKEAEKTPEQRAAEAKARAKAELLRKRRLPMEDTRLHEENKEYGIKAPENLNRRPALPFTLTALTPPHLRGEKMKWGPVMTASQSGTGDVCEIDNDRGLICDALHVYHFFCGDVGFDDPKYPVPKFSVKTLLYALDEVIIGNSKNAKCLPPLISHLFLTALRVLTARAEGEAASSEEVDPIQVQLQKDLVTLGLGLNAVSWSQILFFYIDLMERYYTSDSSLEVEVLPQNNELDMSYLWSKDADGEEKMATESEGGAGKNYRGYIGNPKGALCKAYTKLGNQVEAWNLTAEELMALLRALTDDILSKRADLAADITERGTKLSELKKARNQALEKFRKAKRDFLGPKKAGKKKTDGEDEKAPEDGDVNGDEEAEETAFKPKITQKEFLAAEKAYNKSIEAFDNGIRKLISRTEPLGFDRYFNSYYCFMHDPEMLHVEQLKQSAPPPELKKLELPLNPSRSWHFIDTKALFDQFLGCLDTRGTRENELFEACSTLTVLKRRLLDDKGENTRASAREREKEELERRLHNARAACSGDEGRRSGRLAGNMLHEVNKLEAELDAMAKAHEEEERLEQLGREQASDYSLLTGFQMVRDLDLRKHSALYLEDVTCDKLWINKKTSGNGTLQILAEAFLSMEELCNTLSPWRREDMSREVWRTQLSDVSVNWAKDCVMQLGPAPKEEKEKGGDGEEPSPSKKQKVDDRPFQANVASTIRSCLKELELRVYELSGEKMAFEEADTLEDEEASDDGDQNEIQRRQCWKRKINALKQIQTSRYALIKDIIVAAITVARKSHLNQVAADLKVALQLHRPHAAHEAKVAALGVLEKYGGYDEPENEDDEMDLDELANVVDNNEAEETAISSFLCDEVTMMTGSIGGNPEADLYDWRDVLKTCRSFSRLAAAAQMFITKADEVVYRVQEEKEALDTFLGLSTKKTSTKKSTRSKSKAKEEKFDRSSPVWADCKVTDKLVKGKVKDYPWWPARVCEPYDPIVAKSLSESGYTLISFVGESINYLVSAEEIKPFLEEVEESMEQYDADTIAKLNESTKMAKSIWKNLNRGVASPWRKKSAPHFSEEKKDEP